jgi:hypothetical protein
MPDDVVAESSPAETPVQEPQAPETPPKPEPVGIFDEVPAAEPEKAAPAEKKEEPAPSEAKSEPEGETEAPPEEAKEGSEPEEKPESKAERRIKQLTAQVKAMERQLNEIRYPKPGSPGLTAEPAPPDLETFQGTAEEFKAAQKQFTEDHRKWVAIAERQRIAVEEQKRSETERNARALQDWRKRTERILKSNPEFNEKKMLEVVAPNATTDGFFIESEAGPELLEYLFENPEEADRLRDLAPYKAVRELVKLENKLLDRIKGIKPKPVPKPPAAVNARAGAPAAPKTAADILYG